jgi:hypothetical protein
MSCARRPRGFETLDQQEQRDSAKCQPCDHTEAIHERQQADLMLQLLIEKSVRRCGRVRTRVSLRYQVIGQFIEPTAELLRSSADCRPKIGLVELVLAFRRRCDESNPKTTSPVPEEIRKTGSSVVLVGPQLRIGKHVNRNEENVRLNASVSANPVILDLSDVLTAITPSEQFDANETARSQPFGPNRHQTIQNDILEATERSRRTRL